MKRFVNRSSVEGTVRAPSSKSMMQRAVAIASLGKSSCRLNGLSGCADLFASIRAAEALGAKVELDGSSALITPRFRKASDTVDCGEAGLTVRMFAPIAALQNHKFVFTGQGSLLKRPIDMVEDALIKMGVSCSTQNGFLPMCIEGPVSNNEITVDGSVSSQLITGLLIAYAHCDKSSRIIVNNLTSRPYIDMTIEILSHFGINIINKDYKVFEIEHGGRHDLKKYNVEGDWSGAAFIMVAAALAGTVTINNLSSQSSQGDKEILTIIKNSGAQISENRDSITVHRSILKPFTCDATDCPDLFPPLCALAAGCNGKSRISGIHRLAYKESDRAAVLIEQFKKIGVGIQIEGNDMIINGGQVAGGVAESCNDHRIAMALAVAGLISDKGVTIENAEAVQKSYPVFFEDLHDLGAEVQ